MTSPPSGSRPAVRLALAGGGTGGHVVPGLNLLAGWPREGPPLADLLWFVAGRPVERRALAGLGALVAGIPHELARLELEPEGGGAPSLARLARRLPPAALVARRALRAHRSEVLLGLGGFTSAPAVLAARSLGLPVALLEVNALSGRATRFAAPFARRVFHAWRESLPPESSGGSRSAAKHVWIGPPLAPEHARGEPDEAERRSARAALGLAPTRPCLVVLGGSQGAGALNEFLRGALPRLREGGLEVLHQVGPGRLAEAAQEEAGYRAVEYLDDVRGALAAATLVLSRGGASTLAEIAAARRPALVVPYPHGDRHQERNAHRLGEGIRIVPQETLGPELAGEIVELAGEGGAARRRAMAAALGEAIPLDATARLVEALIRLAHGPDPRWESAQGTRDGD